MRKQPLCIVCHIEPKVWNSGYCRACHLTKYRDYLARKAAQEMCARCGTQPHARRSKFCDPCREIRKREWWERYTRPVSPICTRCRQAPSVVNAYCRPCYAIYRKEYRRTHPKTPAQRKKDSARHRIQHAVERKGFPRHPCRDCGNPKSEAHHHDYDKPLEVVWLCKACHTQEHRVKTSP